MNSPAQVAPLHPMEEQRLQDLQYYNVFGKPTEDCYDDLVQMAADVCGTEIALLSLVGEDQLHFKSRCGFSAEYGSRDGSFCSHAILHEDMMMVEDASKDPRFINHELVMCPDMHVRFYAGVPLLSSGNKLPLGVICVIGDEPQVLTDTQKRSLTTIANQIVSSMELKLSLKRVHGYADKLKKLNENKDKFFSIVAHDLRGAFHGLIGFAEVLDEELHELDSSSIKRIAKYMHESSRETYGMLENLLEWSRLEDGSIAFKPETLDLNSVVHSIKRRLSASAATKQISLHVSVEPDIYLFADKHMIESILHNLVSNALKFSRPDTQVKISTAQTSSGVQMVVSDQGVGMNQSQLTSLFDSNTHKSTRGTNGEAGSGLGLVLSKEFAEKHKGTIEVSSTVGEGTEFVVKFPALKS